MLIMRTTIVCNVALQILLVQNVVTDIVQHICTDQFQSAMQSHPHSPWQLNAMVLGDVSDAFSARIVDRSRFFKVVLVGKVLAVFRDTHRCTYFFDDGTGPRIEIRWWYRAWADVMDNVTYVMENQALTDRLTCCKVLE